MLSNQINNQEINLCEESEKSKIKNIYDPKLFRDQNNIDDYKCSICDFIVDKPIALSCECEGIYCQKCLDEYEINNGYICPICKEEVDSINPNKRFLNRLNKLTIICDQCNRICLYKEYAEHYSNKCRAKLVNIS